MANRKTPIFLLLYLALVLISYIASTVGRTSHVFWAWQHFNNEPEISSLLLFLGIAGLSLAIYALSRTRKNTAWVWLARISVVMGAGALTWYFLLNHSWGDRQTLLEMLIAGKFFRMSQPLTTAIWAIIYSIVKQWDWPPSNAIALSCSIATVVATIILIRFLALSSRREAFALGLLLIPSSLIALFFGYVESTVFTLVCILWFFFQAKQYLESKNSLWKTAIALGTAIAFHGLAVYLIPSLLFLVYLDYSNQGAFLRRRIKSWITPFFALVLPSLIVVGLALAYPESIRGSLIGDAIGGGDHRPFVPLFNLQSEYERYTLFSITHFTEILNLFSFHRLPY